VLSLPEDRCTYKYKDKDELLVWRVIQLELSAPYPILSRTGSRSEPNDEEIIYEGEVWRYEDGTKGSTEI